MSATPDFQDAFERAMKAMFQLSRLVEKEAAIRDCSTKALVADIVSQIASQAIPGWPCCRDQILAFKDSVHEEVELVMDMRSIYLRAAKKREAP